MENLTTPHLVIPALRNGAEGFFDRRSNVEIVSGTTHVGDVVRTRFPASHLVPPRVFVRGIEESSAEIRKGTLVDAGYHWLTVRFSHAQRPSLELREWVQIAIGWGIDSKASGDGSTLLVGRVTTWDENPGFVFVSFETRDVRTSQRADLDSYAKLLRSIEEREPHNLPANDADRPSGRMAASVDHSGNATNWSDQRLRNRKRAS